MAWLVMSGHSVRRPAGGMKEALIKRRRLEPTCKPGARGQPDVGATPTTSCG